MQDDVADGPYPDDGPRLVPVGTCDANICPDGRAYAGPGADAVI